MRHESTPAERKLWSQLRNGQLGGLKFRRQVPLGAYGKTRDAWLRAQGFLVMRFWNGEVLDNLEGVIETITRTLGRG